MNAILRRLFCSLALLCLLLPGARAQGILTRTPVATVADLVIEEAMRYIGTPYRWGGKSPTGFDCAGFTRFIYAKFGIELAPSAAPQYRMGTTLKKEEINKGDLVFYAGSNGSKAIGHVGIVTSVDDDGFSFIHAANTGVCITSSREPYYLKRFIGACRVVDRVVSNKPANEAVVAQADGEYRDPAFIWRVIYVDSSAVYHPAPIAARP